MTEDKARTLVGLSMVELTKHLMSRDGLSREAAFAALLGTKTYAMLDNPDSRLYLEDDEFLCHCLDAERQKGADALYALVKP